MSLTEDEVRSLLRECVTVVRPGETLLFSPADPWTPRQCREFQEYADEIARDLSLPYRMLVLPQGSLAVAVPAHPFPDGPFSPILPVPVDEPPGGWRREPRRFQYHVGGPCPSPKPDGTCGCPPPERADA